MGNKRKSSAVKRRVKTVSPVTFYCSNILTVSRNSFHVPFFQNVCSTRTSPSSTVPKVIRELPHVTDHFPGAGIDFKDLLVNRCLTRACLRSGVARMRQVGWEVVTLQWLKELLSGKCVSIGPLAAVSCLPTSGFVTVVVSMCTSYIQRQLAVYVIVATGSKVYFNVKLRVLLSSSNFKFIQDFCQVIDLYFYHRAVFNWVS